MYFLYNLGKESRSVGREKTDRKIIATREIRDRNERKTAAGAGAAWTSTEQTRTTGARGNAVSPAAAAFGPFLERPSSAHQSPTTPLYAQRIQA